jgi:hypothetical protein
VLFPFFHWTKQTQNPHHADQIPGRSTVPTVSAWSIFDSPQLVGGFNPSEKYESQIRSSSQLLGKKTHVSNHQPDKKHMLVGWIYQKYENNHENNHENNKWLKPPARLVMFHKHSTKTKGFNRNIQSVGDEIDDCRSRSR